MLTGVVIYHILDMISTTVVIFSDYGMQSVGSAAIRAHFE